MTASPLQVKLNSSTVSGNAAETGGALRSSGNSNTSLMSCQVSFNTAKGVSGAVYASGQAQASVSVKIVSFSHYRCCFVWYDTGLLYVT